MYSHSHDQYMYILWHTHFSSTDVIWVHDCNDLIGHCCFLVIEIKLIHACLTKSLSQFVSRHLAHVHAPPHTHTTPLVLTSCEHLHSMSWYKTAYMQRVYLASKYSERIANTHVHTHASRTLHTCAHAHTLSKTPCTWSIYSHVTWKSVHCTKFQEASLAHLVRQCTVCLKRLILSSQTNQQAQIKEACVLISTQLRDLPLKTKWLNVTNIQW